MVFFFATLDPSDRELLVRPPALRPGERHRRAVADLRRAQLRSVRDGLHLRPARRLSGP